MRGDTLLKKLSLKLSLSFTDNAIYLGKFLVEAFSKQERRFAVSYNRYTVSNIPNIETNLNGHNHEEADTQLILHAIDVAEHDPFGTL